MHTVDMVWQFIPMCNEQHIIGRQYNEIQSHHSHEQERERPYVNITIENRPIHRYTRPRLNHIWLSIKASPVLSFFDVIPIFLHQTPTTHSPYFFPIHPLARSLCLPPHAAHVHVFDKSRFSLFSRAKY